MTVALSYWFRFVCLGLTTGVVSYAAGALLSAGLAPWLLRRLEESGSAAAAARGVLGLRLLPLFCAILVVGGLCVPSYLWLEPHGGIEEVSWRVCLLAGAGAVLAGAVLRRLARAGFQSWRYGHRSRLQGEARRIGGLRVQVLSGPAPSMALAGIVRPQLLLSRQALERLTPAQIEAGLRHELAHQRAQDNFKRLLLLACPAPGRRLHALERAWTRLTEWAADDRAAGGDEGRSLTLASTLVAVARLGPAPPAPAPASFLSASSLLGGPNDLADRVRRLLAPAGHTTADRPTFWACTFGAAFAAVVGLMLQPSTLIAMHELLERLAH